MRRAQTALTAPTLTSGRRHWIGHDEIFLLEVHRELVVLDREAILLEEGSERLQDVLQAAIDSELTRLPPPRPRRRTRSFVLGHRHHRCLRLRVGCSQFCVSLSRYLVGRVRLSCANWLAIGITRHVSTAIGVTSRAIFGRGRPWYG